MIKILVIGDSHTQYFKVNDELREIYKELNNIEIIPVVIHGSTIKGFGRRESTLNTRKELFQQIQHENPDYVCLSFGQVDIELGYYYSMVVKNLDLDFNLYCDELINSYMETIIGLNIPLDKIIVKGINVTTLTKSRFKALRYTSRIITENIKNKEEINHLTKVLSARLPDANQRILNHLNFNEKLKFTAKMIGIKYFDINKDIINQEIGTVYDFLIPAYLGDHHLLDSVFVREKHFQGLLSVIYGN